MATIKTAKEILREMGVSNYLTDNEDGSQFYEVETDEDHVVNAMIVYAQQFIDLAVENAKLAWSNDPHPRGYPYFCWNPTGDLEHGDKAIKVDINSILNIKKQIK